MIAEISIGESKHDAVAKHIQSVRTPFLGNASPLTFNALCGNPRGDGQSRVGQTIDSKRRVIREISRCALHPRPATAYLSGSLLQRNNSGRQLEAARHRLSMATCRRSRC